MSQRIQTWYKIQEIDTYIRICDPQVSQQERFNFAQVVFGPVTIISHVAVI